MNVYLAGPMRGYDNLNFPAFKSAAAQLRAAGHYVFNPAEHALPKGADTFAHYMAVDLAQGCKSDAVAVLDGWQNSQGARMEVEVARELGIPVLWAATMDPVDDVPASKPVPAPSLPSDAATRKTIPLWRGTFGYFPDALREVARLCYVANEQHNPGEPMHWARGKSMDHEDCLLRHMLQAGTKDSDGFMHEIKVAWRGLAIAQLAIEKHNKEAQ